MENIIKKAELIETFMPQDDQKDRLNRFVKTNYVPIVFCFLVIKK